MKVKQLKEQKGEKMKTQQEGTFLQKFMFKPLFCRNYCDQSKMKFAKLKEFYVHKMSNYKNLSQFSNSHYGFGPTISILVDKIVYSKFSDFNSISSFNKQFVYKVRERLE